jgi:hypothetical protein
MIALTVRSLEEHQRSKSVIGTYVGIVTVSRNIPAHLKGSEVEALAGDGCAFPWIAMDNSDLQSRV